MLNECGEADGMMRIGREIKYSEETCPSAALFTTNPKWITLGSNPGHHGEKPATNRLNQGTASVAMSLHNLTLKESSLFSKDPF
jgi:hypothetical protein